MIYSIIPTISAVIYIFLIIVIVFNRQWQRQHKLFVLYLLAATFWSVSDAVFRSHFLVDYKLILFRLAILGSVWWVIQLYHFVRAFVGLTGGYGLWLGYASLGTLGVLAAFGVWPESLTFDAGIVKPDLGPSFYLYVGTLFSITVYGLWVVFRKFRTLSEPKERNKLTYMILAIGILAVFGFMGVTSLAHGFPLSTIGALISSCILTYAVARHELISTNYILRRGIAWGGIITLGTMLCIIAFIIINSFISIDVKPINLVLAVLAGIVISICVVMLKNIFVARVDQFFFKERYEYHQELSNFIRLGINRVFSLQELSQKLLPPLVKTLNCQQACILLSKKHDGDFAAEFCEPKNRNGKPPFKLRKDSPIVYWFIQEKKYLTRENMETLPQFRGIWTSEREELRNSGVEILFPLISRGNLIGVLALGRRQSGKYSFEDTNLVESIASQAAINLEKEYYQDELRKRQHELSLINHLASVINSSLRIEDIYDTFVNGLKEVISVDFAAVVLIEEDEICFSALYSDIELSWGAGRRIPLKGSATEWVARHKQTMLQPDLQKDSRFFTSEAYRAAGLRSVVYVPLITKGEVIGSLTIASRQVHAYTAENIHMLESLSSQVSTSVANAQLYAKAEQRSRVDELTGLFNRRHFDESLKQEVERHARYGSGFSLMIMDLDNFKSYNDIKGHLNGDKLLSRVGLIVKKALRNTDLPFRYGGDEFAMILPHTSCDDACDVAERIRSDICADTLSKGIGISASIGLASWPNDALRPDDIINAADNSLYHAKRTGGNRVCIVSQLPYSSSTLDQAVPDVERETLNTIYALAATIEARDPYTYGHSRKVRVYAVALAEALRLPIEKVTAISHAALLHDIGKIGVIDGVLNKPGKLNAKDWDIIKTHPRLSRTIVAHVPSLTSSLPGILHHHERWDGTGYPEGLKGESIPLEARILAISDAFDAMTSLRPYRAPLSFKEAINELKRGSGSQFDPRLVEAFIPVSLTVNPDGLAEDQRSQISDVTNASVRKT